MEDIKANLILNIEINNTELITELNIISMELSLSYDKIILQAISKLISDIKYIRTLKG